MTSEETLKEFTSYHPAHTKPRGHWVNRSGVIVEWNPSTDEPQDEPGDDSPPFPSNVNAPQTSSSEPSTRNEQTDDATFSTDVADSPNVIAEHTAETPSETPTAPAAPLNTPIHIPETEPVKTSADSYPLQESRDKLEKLGIMCQEIMNENIRLRQEMDAIKANVQEQQSRRDSTSEMSGRQIVALRESQVQKLQELYLKSRRHLERERKAKWLTPPLRQNETLRKTLTECQSAALVDSLRSEIKSLNAEIAALRKENNFLRIQQHQHQKALELLHDAQKKSRVDDYEEEIMQLKSTCICPSLATTV
ncbi:hypothetical protein HK104_001812 [Borealophlyctis nickersoniae]|nr:hypothetical protein HK104_001812 [Borealophlyctis nickersoniae]